MPPRQTSEYSYPDFMIDQEVPITAEYFDQTEMEGIFLDDESLNSELQDQQFLLTVDTFEEEEEKDDGDWNINVSSIQNANNSPIINNSGNTNNFSFADDNYDTMMTTVNQDHHSSPKTAQVPVNHHVYDENQQSPSNALKSLPVSPMKSSSLTPLLSHQSSDESCYFSEHDQNSRNYFKQDYKVATYQSHEAFLFSQNETNSRQQVDNKTSLTFSNYNRVTTENDMRRMVMGYESDMSLIEQLHYSPDLMRRLCNFLTEDLRNTLSHQDDYFESHYYYQQAHIMAFLCQCVVTHHPGSATSNMSSPIAQDNCSCDKITSRQFVHYSEELSSLRHAAYEALSHISQHCNDATKITLAEHSGLLESLRDTLILKNQTPPTTPQSSKQHLTYILPSHYQAATILSHISTVPHNHKRIVDCHALAEALAMVAMASMDEETTYCVCRTFTNLTFESVEMRDRLFRTAGVVDALLLVMMTRRENTHCHSGNCGGGERRLMACSALANLTISYDNIVPLFEYPGFLDAILSVMREDMQEKDNYYDQKIRSKLCGILWSLAAETKNQTSVRYFTWPSQRLVVFTPFRSFVISWPLHSLETLLLPQ